MLPQEIIRKKRDGVPLTRAEVKDFISGLTNGSISEGQVAAFAMAVYFKGMSAEEAVGLTLAMRDSGTVLKWDVPGPVVDKHSTGGIGDNISLMLAPMLAACGCYVPMISGRSLGHTGGTLDKLDSIPGYKTQPDLTLFRKVVREAGCAIIGQTADLAPADKRLYGIRDVTATVESVPLITASILSKKLAAGLQHLVMDVKVGTGAFMERREDAVTLAQSLVQVANGAGLKTSALITDMNEPLASCAGNSLEIYHAVEFLKTNLINRRVEAITLALGAELLVSAGLAQTIGEGEERLGVALVSGRAAEHFSRMVALLGGPPDFVERPLHYLPSAPIVRPVYGDDEGVIANIATRQLGLAVIELGGGRSRADDKIDHRVGLSNLLGKNFISDFNSPLCMVHAADEESYIRAAKLIRSAYAVGDSPSDIPPVLERIGS
jgi:thymidine phosphorylase